MLLETVKNQVKATALQKVQFKPVSMTVVSTGSFLKSRAQFCAVQLILALGILRHRAWRQWRKQKVWQLIREQLQKATIHLTEKHVRGLKPPSWKSQDVRPEDVTIGWVFLKSPDTKRWP
jgi:hypothetical protein